MGLVYIDPPGTTPTDRQSYGSPRRVASGCYALQAVTGACSRAHVTARRPEPLAALWPHRWTPHPPAAETEGVRREGQTDWEWGVWEHVESRSLI